jgi:hypothetical protein
VTGVVGGLEQAGHDVRFERPHRGGAAFQSDRGALAPGVASPELPAPGDVLEPHVAQFGEQVCHDLGRCVDGSGPGRDVVTGSGLLAVLDAGDLGGSPAEQVGELLAIEAGVLAQAA